MGYVTIKVVMVQNVAQRSSTFKLKAAAKGRKKKDEKVKSETPQMQTTRERCLRPIMRWFHAPASAHPTNIDSKTE